MTYSLKFIFAVASIVISAGCHSSSLKEDSGNHSASSIGKHKVSQQLIIKFKPSTIACSARAVSSFANEVQVRLEFIRPMSGNACVVIQQATSASDLQQGQQKLKQHPSIEWLEADEVMQTH